MNEVPSFYAKSRDDWRKWLMQNHGKQKAVWLVYDKGAERKLSWQDIVQESLCFGWIDSKPGKVSDTQSKIYISKRKPKSVWSKINKANIDYLIKNNLIMPAGMESVRVAKENGSWDSLNKSDDLIVPNELDTLFSKNIVAQKYFEGLSNSKKRNILSWIYSAKRPETYLNRINATFESCSIGKLPNGVN